MLLSTPLTTLYCRRLKQGKPCESPGRKITGLPPLDGHGSGITREKG